MFRGIVAVVTARETPEGAGAVVRRALPSAQLPSLDPFVLLDEFFVQPPAAFPEHPHRGFEIVTYVLDGSFRHRDTLGNDSTLPAGGIQRITTGRGIQHAEMPQAEGMNRGLQLWINLPRALKGIEPEYQAVPPAAIPATAGDGYRVRQVVGGSSPVRLHTPVLYLDVALEPGKTWSEQVPSTYAGFLYVLEGSGRFGADAKEGGAGQLLVLGPGDEARATASGREPLRFALVAGQPLGEPIRIRGSFVD